MLTGSAVGVFSSLFPWAPLDPCSFWLHQLSHTLAGRVWIEATRLGRNQFGFAVNKLGSFERLSSATSLPTGCSNPRGIFRPRKFPAPLLADTWQAINVLPEKVYLLEVPEIPCGRQLATAGIHLRIITREIQLGYCPVQLFFHRTTFRRTRRFLWPFPP